MAPRSGLLSRRPVTSTAGEDGETGVEPVTQRRQGQRAQARRRQPDGARRPGRGGGPRRPLVSRSGIGLRSSDRLGKDLIGGLDSGEGGCAGVPLAGEALDRGSEDAHVL
jgi:hypothetical protein